MTYLRRHLAATALAANFLSAGAALTPARAVAAELGDYLWGYRPLLVFAPTESDPRLIETVGRVQAGQGDIVDGDMVLGQIVSEGASTLDGQVIDADEAQKLLLQFGIGASSSSVVLIGKGGGEKLRVDDVPELSMP